jgi:hypothetical protein
MTLKNGNGNPSVLLAEDPAKSLPVAPPEATVMPSAEQFPTRAKLRARESFRKNRFVILAAGAVVFALLIFAIVSAPGGRNTSKASVVPKTNPDASAMSVEKSMLPIIDSGRNLPAAEHDGELGEEDVARTATRKTLARTAPKGGGPGSLPSIPPFGGESWQAPPYQPGLPGAIAPPVQEEEKNERITLDKSSLVFVKNATSSEGQSRREEPDVSTGMSLGLSVGTRLRARLDFSASTAVRTPVLAVIEYNYERDGQIIVPAGSKAVGQIQEADRSGYLRIQFDSLLLPDGGRVPIEAAATDLAMRPIKGKVEGKNTGKNILVRSLSGIGEASALLVGRGGLNQPLSESDLIRERVTNNIGQASDEEISRLSITSRVVVTVAAGTEVYVVLEQSSKPFPDTNATIAAKTRQESSGVDQMRQLLQLQQELNQSSLKAQ